MCDGIGVLHFLMSIRIKRLLFYNFVFLFIVLISLNCFDSADGKLGRRKRRNRGTPRMIVFNLDETMWPFQVDKVMTLPLNVTIVGNQSSVVDHVGKVFDLFPGVIQLLDDLERKYYMLGVISQSNDVAKVENLLELFDIDQYLNLHEIFSGSKAMHLKKISERSKVAFEDILYFDSDPTDMKEIDRMKVTTVLIDKNGITVKSVIKGLDSYNATRMAKEAQTTTTPKPYK